MNKIFVIVSALSILSQPLFFSFMGLLGVEYEGETASGVYVAYIVVIAALSVMAYVVGSGVKGFYKSELVVLAFVLLLFMIHALWVILDPIGTKLVPEFMIFFMLFGFPGFLAAATIIKMQLLPQFVRVVELFFLIIAFGIMAFSVLPSFGGVKVASLAGASYQVLSYYSAFTFGMLLIYNLYMPKSLRFSWTRMLWYRSLSYVLMLGCVLACFLGGGRGAFLLLLNYSMFVAASILFNKNSFLTRAALYKTLFRVFSVVLLVSVFFVYFWGNDFVQSGFSRATQFISGSGGIDLEYGSSGRGQVYATAIDYISDEPLIGYGPFGFRDKTIHAHNIFLEIAIQFGILGVVMFLGLLGGGLIRAVRIWDSLTYWVLGLFFYPLTMTMFSGAYLHSAIFCFGLMFFAMYKRT